VDVKGSNTPSIRSLVVDDERTTGCQEGYPAHRTPFYSSSEVFFQNRWRRTEGKTADPGLPVN